MKKTYIIAIFFLILACKKEANHKLPNGKDSITINQLKDDTVNKVKESAFESELTTNEDLISDEDFKVWKGKYRINYEYSDLEYNEFIVFTELNLIKRDSCILENWFIKKEDKTARKYNYVKIIGKIYLASKNNSKIEFMENRVLDGESPNLSPVFSLKKVNNDFLINSILSSPPNNGVIDMTITKK